MKFGIIGDTHFRTESPVNRGEQDFGSVCLKKFENALNIFKQQGVNYIFQTGDLFDTIHPNYAFVFDILQTKKTILPDVPMFCIHGNHDLKYHSIIYKDVSILSFIDKLNNSTHSPLFGHGIYLSVKNFSDINVDLCSYGETPKCNADILVSHDMVGDKPLFINQQIFDPPQYIDKYKGYTLYIVGHYHYPYNYQKDGITVVNPGSLVRLSVADRDMNRIPKVAIYDTDNKSLEYFEVTDKKPEDVFLIQETPKIEIKRDYSELLKILQSDRQVKISFPDNLQTYCKKDNVRNEVIEFIKYIETQLKQIERN
jgi:DNA repair exonuclease SbcCD nuclease subunit